MDRNEGTPTQAQYDALTDAERDEFEAYLDSIEPHYCDFPQCPCDANQNRLLADSRAYYAQEHEIERQRMGY